MQSVHALLKSAQLRWTGLATRMPDERLPEKILSRELQVGKRSHGGQKKRYKDTLQNLPLRLQHSNRVVGTDCPGLSKVTRPQKNGCYEYEANITSEAEQKRTQRKARAKASPTELSSSDLSCSICNRQFRAETGLISHLTITLHAFD